MYLHITGYLCSVNLSVTINDTKFFLKCAFLRHPLAFPQTFQGRCHLNIHPQLCTDFIISPLLKTIAVDSFSYNISVNTKLYNTWNKNPTRCHLVLYLFFLYKLLFISCSICFGPSCVSIGKYVAQRATYFPMDTKPANRIWLPKQPRHCTIREKIPLSRQLLKMGTRWSETCWAIYKEQLIKEK